MPEVSVIGLEVGFEEPKVARLGEAEVAALCLAETGNAVILDAKKSMAGPLVHLEDYTEFSAMIS